MKSILFVILFILTIVLPLASEETISAKAVQKVDAYLTLAVKHDYSGSVLVAHRDKILLNKGYGMADRARKIPFRSGTIFDIGSLTKQFTAAAILKLEMQKKLTVEDPISKYLDGVPEDKKGLTIHQLLTHTAGLPDAVGEDEELIGREEYLKRAFLEKLRSPGQYSYSNVGYSVLTAILEKVSGQEYEPFLRENVFLPSGMKSTGYVLPEWKKEDMAIGYRNNREWGTTYDKSHYEKSVTWHLRGNGGIHSTTEDMYKWYLALQGNKVLSANAKKKYFAPHVPENGDHYAYGWSVMQNQRKETVIAHNGGNGYFMATFAMIPSRDFVVIASSNNDPKNTDTIASRIYRILSDNLQPLDPQFTNTFTGEYSIPGGGVFAVRFDENDSAIISLNNSPAFRLLSGSRDDKMDTAADYDSKVFSLLKSLKAGDISAAANAAPSNVTPQEAEQFLKQMRDEIQQQKGEIRSVEVLGSVSRQEGKIYLTAAKIQCEKGDLYQLYVWRAGRISEIRPPEENNIKPFEHQEGNEFYAESNERNIVFRTENGKPAAVVGNLIAFKNK